MIATDMDGTFLDSSSTPSAENIEAFKEAINHGYKVVISTGRIFSSIKSFARLFDYKVSIIACNGAIVRESYFSPTLYKTTIKHEDAIKLMDIAKKKDIYYHFFNEETLFTMQLKFGSLLYKNWNDFLPDEDKVPIEVVDDPYEIAERNKDSLVKFVFSHDDPEYLEEVRDEIEKLGVFEITKSTSYNIEIMAKNTSKGGALKLLAEKFKIKRDNVIAIGDSLNDLSMIQYAGLGVAVANAEKIVLKSADIIAPSNDDNGVASIVNKFMLNKN